MLTTETELKLMAAAAIGVGRRARRHRIECHSTLRAGAGLIDSNLRVHRARIRTPAGRRGARAVRTAFFVWASIVDVLLRVHVLSRGMHEVSRC